MEVKQQHRRRDLADNGRERRADDAHFGHRAEAVDHNGVENDVDDRARDLTDGRVDRAAGRLKQLFEEREENDAERQHAADKQIIDRHADDLLIRGLRHDIRPHTDKTEQQAQHIDHRAEKQAVARDSRRLFPVVLTERARKQRIHADARTDTEGDHEHLHRKDQRQRVERRLASLTHIADEGAVHDVVNRLERHGKYHRDAHCDHQPFHRHLFHSVVFRHFFEFLLLFAQKERAAPPKAGLTRNAARSKNKKIKRAARKLDLRSCATRLRCNYTVRKIKSQRKIIVRNCAPHSYYR